MYNFTSFYIMIEITISKDDFKKSEIPWLELGLKTLAIHGLSNIKIDVMSKKLNISRTSFYHLFTSKNNYIYRLCEFWAYSGTFKYIERLQRIEKPSEKLIEIIRFISRDRLEGIAWISYKHIGDNNHEVKNILHKIESLRIEFVSGILIGLGYSDEQAKVKARVLMYFLFGWLVLEWPKEKKNEISESEIIELLRSIEIDLNFHDSQS
ncbi:TetR/AcrR family transcriptional regulator [Lutimonas sp.]|uniref:TetR/AcrR family transcriptional regulator n=1 Tax=Lutimonas sp. TaxID=1872403 RepID=UPI003D9BD713